MDFVASRADEAKYGWRNRVGQFLAAMGVTVFDPWNKPQVRGLHEYGREGVGTVEIKNEWTFARGRRACAWKGSGASGRRSTSVRGGIHPTSSSPTARPASTASAPHEIIVAREQHKPVLFVSPPVRFDALDALRAHLAADKKGTKLLDALAAAVPIKDNPEGIPSLWYLPLVGGEAFFDGFGFKEYRRRFGWPRIPLDDHEDAAPPKNPLLPYIERIQAGRLPQKWDNRIRKFVRNDDWLLWKLPAASHKGKARA
jgi:hypothetical protein